jgi:hypothetical protein
MPSYSIRIILDATDVRDPADVETALRHDELAEDASVTVRRGTTHEAAYVAIRPGRPAGYYLRGGTDEDRDIDEVWDWRERLVAWLEHFDPAATLELRREDGTPIAGTLLTAVEHADPDRREAAEALAGGAEVEWTFVRLPAWWAALRAAIAGGEARP